MVDVKSIPASVYQAVCHYISRKVLSRKVLSENEYYLLEGDFGNDVDEIIDNLLAKY